MPRHRSHQPARSPPSTWACLLLVAVVIAALLGSQVHTHIAVEVERAICKITGSSACGEPGVPEADARTSRARRAGPLGLRRRVQERPPRPAAPRRGRRPVAATRRPTQVYDNLGRGLRLLRRHVRPRLLRRRRRRADRVDQLLRDPGTPTRNAYWDGTQMMFGDGYAAEPRHHRPRAHARGHGAAPPTSSTSASRARSTSRCRTSSPPTSTPTTGRSARTCRAARSATWRTPRTATRRSPPTSTTSSRCPTTATPTTTAAACTTTAGSRTTPTT